MCAAYAMSSIGAGIVTPYCPSAYSTLRCMIRQRLLRQRWHRQGRGWYARMIIWWDLRTPVRFSRDREWMHRLCWECWRHVANMSPTADNIGKILPTGQCRDIDTYFFFGPAQKNVGKWHHFINTHNSTPLKLSTSKLNNNGTTYQHIIVQGAHRSKN